MSEMRHESMEDSIVWQLCRAITARRPPHWVMVIEAYADETGVHAGAPITGVAAYLADGQQWFQFEQAWLGVLQQPEFNIEVFRQSDYETFNGEFKDWDVGKKLAFGKCLFPILPAHTWCGRGYAIVNRDFDDAMIGHEELKTILSSPYMICFQRVVEVLLEKMESAPPDTRLALFHENNDFTGEAQKCWDQWLKPHDKYNRLISLTFGGKKDFVPLQAADALAYESYKALNNYRYDKGRRRESLEIMRRGDILTKFWDRENLARAVPRLETQLRAESEPR